MAIWPLKPRPCPHGTREVRVAQPGSYSNMEDMQHAPYPHSMGEFLFSLSRLTTLSYSSPRSVLLLVGSPDVVCKACDPLAPVSPKLGGSISGMEL